MFHYEYIGLTPDGKKRQGVLDAETLQDLKAFVTRQGLFLVSWRTGADTAGAAVTGTSDTPHAITDFDKLSSYQRLMARLQTPKALILLGTLVVGSVIGDYVYLARFSSTNPFFTPTTAADEPQRRLNAIHVGVTRAQVERLLTGSREISSDARATRYALDNGATLEVAYDAAGGAHNAANRVSAPWNMVFDTSR